MSEEEMEFSEDDFNYTDKQITISVRTIGIPENLPKNGVILDLKGILNIYSANPLKGVLANLINAGKTKIYVYMKQLDNIDSSGLGGLIAVQTKLLKINGVLKVVEPSDKARSVLKLTNLESYFHMNDIFVP
ncbi:MAG TPA: STAS domain-containing protein [Leptospiraceae bacterium]|nr:STAS domain-containing protein [Leptospiraceae bacterium]MBK7055675.1 STAS domain-containing protein [Leptospiraceae bacterium]MBK9502185.1 STAS domain-containing protein [Leptospiraceae bacterium]HRG47149.1 STAS domain-containing protein [Leptospiraceae bacterium]HRG77186.1 STAS domain-containing protein [Leptospiraceae bacterium]